LWVIEACGVRDFRCNSVYYVLFVDFTNAVDFRRILSPTAASAHDMQEYHTEDYIKYESRTILRLLTRPCLLTNPFCIPNRALRAVDARGAAGVKQEVLEEYGLENDCTPFPGMWQYISMVAGSTLRAARFLTDYFKEHPPTEDGAYKTGTAPVAMHWLGGRHRTSGCLSSGLIKVFDGSHAARRRLNVVQTRRRMRQAGSATLSTFTSFFGVLYCLLFS
jgi:hypothetical protein